MRNSEAEISTTLVADQSTSPGLKTVDIASWINRGLKLARGLIGVFIMMVLSTSMLLPSIIPVTGKSIVNAELVWLRTPIQGNVSYGEHLVGETVLAGEKLGVVVNARVDDSLIDQLKHKRETIKTTLVNMNQKRVSLEKKKIKISQSLEIGRAEIEQSILLKKIQLLNDLENHGGERKILKDEISRFKKANRDFSSTEQYGVVSRAELDSRITRLLVVETKIKNCQNSLEMLETELESLKHENFVGESIPLQGAEYRSVVDELVSMDEEYQSLVKEMDQTSKTIEERAGLLDLYKEYELKAAVNGVLWDIGFADQSFVNNGDSLIAIADYESLVIECIFHQRYLNNIEVGDHATIAPLGGEEKLKGRVTKVLIRDNNGARLNAFNIGGPASNEIKVLVSVNKDEIESLMIGQRAKVVISKTSNDTLSSLLLSFNR